MPTTTTSASGSGAAPKRVRPATRSLAPPPYPPTAEELAARGLATPRVQETATPDDMLQRPRQGKHATRADTLGARRSRPSEAPEGPPQQG